MEQNKPSSTNPTPQDKNVSQDKLDPKVIPQEPSSGKPTDQEPKK